MKEFYKMMKEDFEFRVIMISASIMLVYMTITMCIPDPGVSILAMFAALPLTLVNFLVAEEIIYRSKCNKK